MGFMQDAGFADVTAVSTDASREEHLGEFKAFALDR